MNPRLFTVLCIVPLALCACGQSSSPPDPPPFPDASSARSGDQGINWPPDVDMITKQRVGMDIGMADELAKVFPAAQYPSITSLSRSADVLRRDPTLANAEPLEAEIEAFGEGFSTADEAKMQEAMAEAMMNQMQSALTDYMVQTTTALLTELSAAFPESRYPTFAEFKRVADRTLANPSPEAGDQLMAEMETFKASLSPADRQRVEDIMDSVERQQATVATEQGNEVAVQMWIDIAEDQKDQIWSTLGAKISKVAFNELVEGTSYERAVVIMEREGSSMGRVNGTFNGVTTVSEAFQWAWQNRDGTHGKVEAYFIDQELRAKVYFDDF